MDNLNHSTLICIYIYIYIYINERRDRILYVYINNSIVSLMIFIYVHAHDFTLPTYLKNFRFMFSKGQVIKHFRNPSLFHFLHQYF